MTERRTARGRDDDARARARPRRRRRPVRTSKPQSAMRSDSTSRRAASSSTTRTENGVVSMDNRNLPGSPRCVERADETLANTRKETGRRRIGAPRPTTVLAAVACVQLRTMIRKRDGPQKRSGCSMVRPPAILPSFCNLRRRVGRVLARQDLVLAFGQRDGAVRQTIDLRERRRIEVTRRLGLAATDEEEALAAFFDEDALLDQLVLRADDVVRGVLFRRQLADRVGQRDANAASACRPCCTASRSAVVWRSITPWNSARCFSADACRSEIVFS